LRKNNLPRRSAASPELQICAVQRGLRRSGLLVFVVTVPAAKLLQARSIFVPVTKPHLISHAGSEQPAPHAHDLEQVLEQTGEAVIVKDMNAVVTFWNREACAMYGFSAAEALGQPMRALHCADLSEADYNRILARVRAGIPTASVTERRKKSGEILRVALKTTPLFDDDKNLVGEITVARDVTALHRNEDALRACTSDAASAARGD